MSTIVSAAGAVASIVFEHEKDVKKHKERRIQPRLTTSLRSKILKLPKITKPHSTQIVTNGESKSNQPGKDQERQSELEKNPFRRPSDVEVFAMREEERRVKQQAKEAMKTQSIHEKNIVKRKNFKELLMEDPEDIDFYDSLRKRNADNFLVNRQTRVDRNFGKEYIHDYISKKREMFLVQYALGVKREEMRKLEEISQAEEQKLLDDEKTLEEDAAKFDAFLKENDKNSVEAIKKAEMETKAKLEKIQEIKKLNVQIMSIRSDMSKNEDQLKDLQRYRQFLEKLTPKEFCTTKKNVSENPHEKDSPVAIKNRVDETSHDIKQVIGQGTDNTKTESRKIMSSSGIAFTTESTPSLKADKVVTEPPIDLADEELLGENECPALFFNTPEQLLDIFAELEENNLALIQNCQETEGSLEELKTKIAETSSRMESETSSLNQQIDFLNASISMEEEKARMLEERAKLFTSGTVRTELQEKLLDDLNHKVKEVYRRCLGDNDGNLSTLQMLTSIENRLEQLFELIEQMPPEKVGQAEKIKDKERRQRLREEKMEAQRILQEERVQRALERARAPVKKKVGQDMPRPIVFKHISSKDLYADAN
ncbi:hypothetical protein BASA62_001413 [Batrachochytrium salamandrivorans]|nr:hypothetical protein BASA62_001413 [Batrachochytrium salamandrivorans]